MTFNPNHLRRIDLAVRRRATLSDFADRMAGIWGDRLMMVGGDGHTALTYNEAAHRVALFSTAIARLVDPGDRVLICTDNSYDQFLLSLAASRAGAIAVPVNSQMQRAELDHIETDCGAKLRIGSVSDLDIDIDDSEIIEATDHGVDETAALFYTSGTTGKPKGVELTHRALVGQSASAALWPTRLRDDEILVPLPVAHIMGFMVLVSTATAGIRVRFLQRFDADEVLDLLEAGGVTAFVGVPAMYRMMLEAGAEQRDLGSVRAWMSGADVMPADLARTFKRLGASVGLPLVGNRGEATFIEGYGMVEVGGGAAAKVSLPFMNLGGGDSVGFRLPGYKFRVVDVDGADRPLGAIGELLIKGPGVLKGYWNAPDATREALTDDGWLRTGDLVRKAPFGAVVFCGRLKQVIKSGGYSVYPLEIETTLEEHPSVAEAAVIGLRDPKLGEVPVAVVRLNPGARTRGTTIQKWSEEQLSHYKVPRSVVVVDDLPRTGTKKVQKARLLEYFE